MLSARNSSANRSGIRSRCGSRRSESWQARIGDATDAIAQTCVESMSYDWRPYKVGVAGSIAYATMLAKAGSGVFVERVDLVQQRLHG